MRRYRMDEKEFSEINITPFTDVVLVLLIIFMITSPLLITRGMKVKLPKSSTTEQLNAGTIKVYLTADNHIFINDLPVSLGDVENVLQKEFIKENTTEVVIDADSNALHGNVVQLLDVLKESGASKLLIGAVKK
jgi:biopolymer transport protein ExbD